MFYMLRPENINIDNKPDHILTAVWNGCDCVQHSILSPSDSNPARVPDSIKVILQDRAGPVQGQVHGKCRATACISVFCKQFCTCSALRIFSICLVRELCEVPCCSSKTAFSACESPACSTPSKLTSKFTRLMGRN